VHTDVVIKHRLRPEKHSPFRRFKTARQGCGLTLYHFSNFRSRFWKFSSSFQAQSSRLSNTLPYSTTTPKISLLYHKCPLFRKCLIAQNPPHTTSFLSQSSKDAKQHIHCKMATLRMKPDITYSVSPSLARTKPQP
jgi:hypothetical protein